MNLDLRKIVAISKILVHKLDLYFLFVIRTIWCFFLLDYFPVVTIFSILSLIYFLSIVIMYRHIFNMHFSIFGQNWLHKRTFTLFWRWFRFRSLLTSESYFIDKPILKLQTKPAFFFSRRGPRFQDTRLSQHYIALVEK